MNFLYLRGAIPENILIEDVAPEIESDNTDVYVNLWSEISEIVGGTHIILYHKNRIEDIKTIRYKRTQLVFIDLNNTAMLISFINDCDSFDFIFIRAALPIYTEIINHYKRSKKIYYGAGTDFDFEKKIMFYPEYILVDSDRQSGQAKIRWPLSTPIKFIKPAARCFRFDSSIKKNYDVCFIGNYRHHAIKGFKLIYNSYDWTVNILHIGDMMDNRQYEITSELKSVVRQVSAKRCEMWELINSCKCGIVPYFNKLDSCPRVIPEMLACGLPLIIADTIPIFRDKYPAIYTSKNDIYNVTNRFVHDSWTLDMNKSAAKHYKENLTLRMSAETIIKGIK